LMPAAEELAAGIKSLWFVAELFLFVLTGCVIRPAIDAGLGTSLFGNFLAVLLAGSAARLAGDVVVAILWQWTTGGAPPWRWRQAAWAMAARRVAFVWAATTPKATLQGTFGPKLATAFAAAAAGLDASYAGPAAFVAPAAAVAILYCATAGTILTFTVGAAAARVIQAIDDKLPAAGEATPGDGTGRAADTGVVGGVAAVVDKSAAATPCDDDEMVGRVALELRSVGAR
jgi:hypothetical protein